MAEDNAPPAARGGGGGLGKAEAWVGKHKVVAIGGGLGLGFLILSQRGKNVTVPGAVINAVPDPATGSVTQPDTTGDDPNLTGDTTTTTTPPPTTTPPTTTPDPTPVTSDVPPPAPAPAAAAPSPIAAPVAPKVAPTLPPAPAPVQTVPTTISTVPPPPAQQAQQAVTYTDVPGYYTRILGYTKSTGSIREWHHYTSGTRAGDLVMSGVVGSYPKNQTRPPAGWTTANVLRGHEDWESPQGSVQYEVTHQAAVNRP